MTEFYAFVKEIVLSPVAIIFLTAVATSTASLIPAYMQIKSDQNKQEVAYNNARRDTYFHEKKKVYFDFIDLIKQKTCCEQHRMAEFVTALGKLEVFATASVAECATKLLPYIIPSGGLVVEILNGKHSLNADTAKLLENGLFSETEEEKKVRLLRSAVLQNDLYKAMQADLQEYVTEISILQKRSFCS